MDGGMGDGPSDDAWGDDLHAPQPTRPRPSTLTPSASLGGKARSSSMRTVSSPATAFAKSPSPKVHTSITPVVSPVATPPPGTSTATGVTKEEKAAEMARRKEERKQVCSYPHVIE